MVIDGVVDAEEHFDGSWLHSVQLADEAIAEFFKMCFEAGPACAFFRNDSSANSMQKRYDALIADLKNAPISLSDPRFVQFPMILTWVDVAGWMLINIYSQSGFKDAATVLAELEHRNATALNTLAVALGTPAGVTPPSECDWNESYYGETEAKLIIVCNDQHGRYNISSAEKLKEFVHELEGISHYIGDVWSSVITLNCRNHAFMPPESQIFQGFKKTITANPILFTTNTIDPVASSSDKMSAFFPGSVVLRQNAVGHGLPVGVSNCTSAHVSKFMETGKLPPAGIVCDILNPNPFLAGNPTGVSLVL